MILMLVLIHLQGCDRNVMAGLLWMFFFNCIIIFNIMIIKPITLHRTFTFTLRSYLSSKLVASRMNLEVEGRWRISVWKS